MTDKAPERVFLRNGINGLPIPPYVGPPEMADVSWPEYIRADLHESLQAKLETALKWDDIESARNDELQAKCERLSREKDAARLVAGEALAERDALKAEVERLKASNPYRGQNPFFALLEPEELEKLEAGDE